MRPPPPIPPRPPTTQTGNNPEASSVVEKKNPPPLPPPLVNRAPPELPPSATKPAQPAPQSSAIRPPPQVPARPIASTAQATASATPTLKGSPPPENGAPSNRLWDDNYKTAAAAAKYTVTLPFSATEGSLRVANNMNKLFSNGKHQGLEIKPGPGGRPLISHDRKIEHFASMDQGKHGQVIRDLKSDPDLLVNLYKNMILGSAASMYGRGFDSLVVSQDTNGKYIQVPVTLGVHNLTPSGGNKNPQEGLFSDSLNPRDIEDFIKVRGKFGFMEASGSLIREIYSNPTPEQKQRLNEFISKELPEISAKLEQNIGSANRMGLASDDTVKVMDTLIRRIDNVRQLTPDKIEEMFPNVKERRR